MTPQWVRWIAFGMGVVLYAATVAAVVQTLVVPRSVRSRLVVKGRTARRLFLTIANRFESYEMRDRILAFQAPVALLMMLITWLVLFWLACAVMIWPLGGNSLLEALRESGSSLLTLGFAAEPSAGVTLVYFTAATSGLVVVALLIAYLPALYSAFNERERLVTMLQSRGGVPAWGPEILWRHQLTGLVSSLGDLYTDWERWAADVAETHTNYPILIHFRSPHPLRSWLVALLAVLDSAAMYLSLSPNTAPSQARLCLRMGFVCLREIADAVDIRYDPDPFPDDPIQLTYEEFVGGIARLEDFPMERTPEEAWPHFRGWRVNYEEIAYALADFVVAPPGPWSGEREHLPGMAFVPQRPANRTPEDRKAEENPKIDPAEWRRLG